jgi:hypothetical protein
LRIEPRARFVEEQQVRIADECAGDRQPLLLTARELDHPARTLALEFDEGEQLVDRLAAIVERTEQASVSSTVSLSMNCDSCSWMPSR